MSSTLPEQLNQVLDVVGKALVSVKASHTKSTEREKTKAKRQEQAKATNSSPVVPNADGKAALLEATHTQEKMALKDSDGNQPPEEVKKTAPEEEKTQSPPTVHVDESAAVASLPIVIIRNFASKRGSAKEESLNALATWAATLAENQVSNLRCTYWRVLTISQVAHVVVVSDNRENVKRLAKGESSIA